MSPFRVKYWRSRWNLLRWGQGGRLSHISVLWGSSTILFSFLCFWALLETGFWTWWHCTNMQQRKGSYQKTYQGVNTWHIYYRVNCLYTAEEMEQIHDALCHNKSLFCGMQLPLEKYWCNFSPRLKMELMLYICSLTQVCPGVSVYPMQMGSPTTSQANITAQLADIAWGSWLCPLLSIE